MTISYPPKVKTNMEAMGIANLLPGAEILGYGFNIFADYSFDSAIQPLFNLGKVSPWKAPSGVVYSLPANIPAPGGSSASASAKSFASSSEFASYFQNSASVSGSVGAFSASFSETYSTSQQNANSNSWALVEADYVAWHANITYGPQILRDNIKHDPDWSGLPKKFIASDMDNVAAFYRFFQKFGTHFISKVSVGGTLYYYFAVSTAESYTSTQIELSASAEFKGLISSVQAQATAEWNQCASNWAQNRQSHAVTVPATAGVIDWVNPAAGSWDESGNFAAWKTAVTQNPSRCNFSLTPIWALYSGAQADALQQAYAAYGSNRVSVQASLSGTATIMVNSTPIVPPGGYPPAQTGPYWQMVVLDRKTLGVKLNRLYHLPEFAAPNWPDPTCNAIAADLQPYVGSKDYILVSATTDYDAACSPNTNLYATLKSFGGSAGLDQWMKDPNHGCASGWGSAVYALVGAGASVLGLEGFADTYFGMPPSSTLTINALLLPIGGSFSPMPYSP
jgi:MAC/Perforin domain-containing protein